MDLSVKQLLESRINQEQEDRKTRERSGKWSPSSFGQCMRRQYWNRLNEPPTNPPDTRVLYIFKVGNLFEDFIFSLLPEGIDRQVRVETENVLGFADGVTEDTVIETKTQHSRKFWHINKEKQADNEFSITQRNPDHILQAGFYAVELDKKFIHLVYISKDDLCIDEYKIPVTEDLKAKIANEISSLQTLWNFKSLPPAQPRLYGRDKYGKPKECNYCQWKDKCFKMEGR